MLVKRCPECREEYMPHVEVCADCGATLVAHDGSADEEAHADAAALPPGEYRLLLVSNHAAELDPLVAHLAALGVPVKVEVSARRQGFELRVRDEDRAAAQRALHEVAADLVGDMAAGEVALGRHFDAERGAYSACPACQSALPAGAQECPECGLQLAGEILTCERCGAELHEGGGCGACAAAAD